MQVHVVTLYSLWVILLSLEMIQQAQWEHFSAQSVLSCRYLVSLALFFYLALHAYCTLSKVNRHRFGALGATHFTHYSKCQLCKWSAVSLSSHIIWIIALWQPYLFWCSIQILRVLPAISLMPSLLSGYRNMLPVHHWHLNECITQKNHSAINLYGVLFLPCVYCVYIYHYLAVSTYSNCLLS